MEPRAWLPFLLWSKRRRFRLTMRCGRDLQKAQREELKKLVKKYGRSWEPWKAELQKFKGEGKEWLD